MRPNEVTLEHVAKIAELYVSIMGRFYSSSAELDHPVLLLDGARQAGEPNASFRPGSRYSDDSKLSFLLERGHVVVDAWAHYDGSNREKREEAKLAEEKFAEEAAKIFPKP